MSLGLNKTKRRISSIETTQKITKAMEMIATVKLKSFKDAFAASSSYLDEVTKIIGSFIEYDGEEKSHYTKENENAQGSLYIIITSSLGLCAGYNNNIFKFVESTVDKEKDTILMIGEKGAAHYSFDKSYKNRSELQGYLSLESRNKDILKFSMELKNAFNEGKYRKINIIYTKYINSLSFEPSCLTLLPLYIKYKKEKNEDICPPLFNPGPREALHLALPNYLFSQIKGKIIESSLSEQASRRNAMESANDNADELLAQLRIEYNKARQTSITQEIVEIVGGANASK
ncbi:MAG: ATP synthase F1 subunit gamma [Bacilli bacterium]|nr:ATP synthase F1 subunit gamma [Bacilli bacterium]MDY6430868.1 ATP synthase F1 subunit gamma [Bacilli bacterium]